MGWGGQGVPEKNKEPHAMKTKGPRGKKHVHPANSCSTPFGPRCLLWRFPSRRRERHRVNVPACPDPPQGSGEGGGVYLIEELGDSCRQSLPGPDAHPRAHWPLLEAQSLGLPGPPLSKGVWAAQAPGGCAHRPRIEVLSWAQCQECHCGCTPKHVTD